jgi:DNA-binding transcriptional MerR regulator
VQSLWSAEQLANLVNQWCDQHGVVPANGQAAERITPRSIRYYRTLGLVDAPLGGGGEGFGEKHRLQLVAIRLLQAQGLPLARIRELLFGRSLEELRQIQARGLAELQSLPRLSFSADCSESWTVTPLNSEFLLVSRRGRRLSPELRERLLAVLNGSQPQQQPEPESTRNEN